MAALITYTVLTIGGDGCRLHQLHTSDGKFFVMGEVAMQLFQETPTSFLQELRTGKYARTNSSAPDVQRTIVQLGLQVEGSAGRAGVVLLPPATVEQLLVDKRQLHLVASFRLAMLKLATQEAARLMASREYDAALPVALEAVALGEQLFKPQPALQLFPLYLLAAQANLGLRRAAQCEKCLALASLLAVKEPAMTTNAMRSQLSRLYGQLFAFQGKAREALSAFAEDVYFCSLDHGPQDPRTTLGYFNVCKVLQSQGDAQGALACAQVVVDTWTGCLRRSVLCQGGAGPPAELPVGRLQLVEVAAMLQDIASLRAEVMGARHPDVAAAHAAAGLAHAELGEARQAMEQLAAAKALLEGDASPSAAAKDGPTQLLRELVGEVEKAVCASSQ